MNKPLKHRYYLLYFSLLFLLSITCTAQAREIAGIVELADGTVWIQGANNKIRPIKVDQPIYEGDIIITGKDGELQARMQDNAFIAVRANSKLKIESYRAQGDAEDNAVFSLLIGTFRSVTGWIGKYNRKNYAIHTTTATIGVRGTDHEPMYIPPPVPGMKPLGEPGVYDKVNSGRIVMKNKFGETEFGQGQAGFISLKSTGKAVRLKGIPTFFKPSKNEQRINKVKKRLYKQLDQRLLKKQRRAQQKPSPQINNKPLPELLNRAPQRRGFIQQKDQTEKTDNAIKPQQRKIIHQEKFERPNRPIMSPSLISPKKPTPLEKNILPPAKTKSLSPKPIQPLNTPKINNNPATKLVSPTSNNSIKMIQSNKQPTQRTSSDKTEPPTAPSRHLAPEKNIHMMPLDSRQSPNSEQLIRSTR